MKLCSKHLTFLLLFSLALALSLFSDSVLAEEKKKEGKLLSINEITKPFKQYKDSSYELYSLLAGYRSGNYQEIYYISCPPSHPAVPEDVDPELFYQGYNLAKEERHSLIDSYYEALRKCEDSLKEARQCSLEIQDAQNNGITILKQRVSEQHGKRLLAESKLSLLERKLESYSTKIKELEQELTKYKNK